MTNPAMREQVADIVADAIHSVAEVNEYAAREMANSAAQEILSLLEAPAAGFADVVERYRHVKRGTVYEVIGHAELQNALGDGCGEGDRLVIYRGEDGKVWAREQYEFADGRFEPLDASQIRALKAPGQEGEGPAHD